MLAPFSKPDLPRMQDWRALAQREIDNKTKPLGALGRLEALAVEIAAWQGTLAPGVDPVHTIVFAADHGIAAAGVSAYPQAVTAEMVRNFARGGAAINVLARQIGASLEVVDVGVATPLEALPGVVAARCGSGTANMVEMPAMSSAQLDAAIAAGAAAVARRPARLYVLGEMGIGNTSSAAALAAAWLGLPAIQLAGPGTGLSPAAIERKAACIDAALRRVGAGQTMRRYLQELGGFEIAALVGAMHAAARERALVLVDGYIATAAAAYACALQPACRGALVFAHRSAEPGHRWMLDALGAEPLLDLGLRLGEGTGAALAVPLLRAACALLGEMATFDSAGVSRSAESG
jgi:nicotinate-nucleotide--dimethylbenzimidazole phosphoribosyltransferase